ncbi:MAG: putative lipid II flippase FtsW [Pseudoflavonifractor sp.]
MKRDLTMEEQLARGPLDMPFLMLVVLLTGIGLVMMFSASYASAYYDANVNNNPLYYFMRQAIFAVMGLGFMYLISKINYQNLRWLSVFVLGAGFLLLVLVLIPGIGVKVNGARRWIRSIGPIPQFQPSEVMKLGVILYFSARMSKRNTEKPKRLSPRSPLSGAVNWLDRSGFFELIPYGLILGAVMLLMKQQPHMSGTILILAAGASILFAGGVKLGWFALGGLGAAVMLWAMLNGYQSGRIDIFKDPWAFPQEGGWQTIQSLLAIGSGGLLGVGLGNSRQKFLYLPEPENDFIFAIVCEELGFIGAAVVLILFALLIIRGYWIAIHARDRFGSLMVVGITTLLAVQVFLNIAVVAHVIPVTGVSLPFFSYGGTALLIQLAEMGIILSVSRQIPAARQG